MAKDLPQYPLQDVPRPQGRAEYFIIDGTGIFMQPQLMLVREPTAAGLKAS